MNEDVEEGHNERLATREGPGVWGRVGTQGTLELQEGSGSAAQGTWHFGAPAGGVGPGGLQRQDRCVSGVQSGVLQGLPGVFFALWVT